MRRVASIVGIVLLILAAPGGAEAQQKSQARPQAKPQPKAAPARTQPARAASQPSAAAKQEPVSAEGESKQEEETAEFREKLSEMLNRTEKSIKILREQITESQSAPFLPDLYLQLGDLLTQRSNTLYYVQMEKLKGGGAPDAKDKAMAPVVSAQKEAILLYKQLLKEFPLFPKRPTVLYRMALAHKSIDEAAAFTSVAGDLLKTYPASEEAMRTRLLLGQHYFERRDYPAAMTHLQPVAASPYPYERNLAKYRIGLIAISKEDYSGALRQFEQVITDDALKEQDNPYEISLKSRKTKSDLKREALIDSIRAYTHVYAKNPDPVGYYSRIAPTEIHFQETIEKLALRYIFIKRYESAVKLLRTLSERTADPQKIVNIYQEVLMMIPVRERVNLPIEEIGFVLERYSAWSESFELPKRAEAQAYAFFEKQVRDLATTAHELAKAEKDGTRRGQLLGRARDFYLLYLGFFGITKESPKMATNLADVYFRGGDYLKSGDYYLRTFNGEFGKPHPSQLKLLIENAALSLQKKREYPFYENLRKRGLLIHAVQSWMAWDPKQKRNPQLNFLLVKSEYEQGFFPEALENLLTFMKDNPRSRYARDAGELILDYFNTRNDFSGLTYWVDRMLALKIANQAFNRKLAQAGKVAKGKVLQERVKETKGYDEFSVGKSYLTAALSSEDSAFASMALREALAKSKAERDFKTFFVAAYAMADNERDQKKKIEIVKSVSREYGKLTRFYESVESARKVQADANFPSRVRADALEEEINTLLLLRDLPGLSQAVSNPLFASVGSETKNRVRTQLAEALESPMKVSDDLVRTIFTLGVNDDVLLALYKAQGKLGGDARTRTLGEVNARCGQESRQAVCKWSAAAALEPRKEAMIKALQRAPTDLGSIEKYGQAQATMLGAYNAVGGSGDAQLEMLVSLRMQELYHAFGEYLARVAKANRELAQVLIEKSRESHASAAMYLTRCKSIGERSTQVSPAGRYCVQGASPDLSDVLKWGNVDVSSPSRSDPHGGKIDELQAALFAGKGGASAWLELVREYYDRGYYRHSAAASAYGMSLYKQGTQDYKTMLGCSLVKLGFLSEGNFHLKSGGALGGMRNRCLQGVQQARMAR